MYSCRMSPTTRLRMNSRPITAATASRLAPAFACLADATRLRLFDLVRRSGPGGICSCDLTEPLDRSQPTVSHHLKVLREAGLVEARRDGNWVWYSVSPEAIATMERFLRG